MATMQQHSLLSLLLLLLLPTATPLPPPPPTDRDPSNCALALISLSPCLAYMAGPPNRPTPAPSPVCCGAFYQSIVVATAAGAGPTCMCHLLRDPLVLGFPIDTGRLVAMFPSCKVNTTSSAVHWLYETCRVTETETETLSPLPRTASGPSTATNVNSSSDEMWAQGHPTPAKSIAACRIVEMRRLWGGFVMVWLVLSIVLHM